MIQDLSGSKNFKGTGESMIRVDSPVPLMHHDPDRSWITDPDLDHPKGTQPNSLIFDRIRLTFFVAIGTKATNAIKYNAGITAVLGHRVHEPDEHIK